MGIPGFWFPLGPIQAIAGIWGVNQWIEDICLRIFPINRNKTEVILKQVNRSR